MTWATSVCLIPGIIQSGAGETSSTGIHRAPSQDANAVQSKSRRRGGGRKEKSHENNRAEKEEMILADAVRVSSEVMGQVRERQEFANQWLSLSLCQILK